MRQAISGGQETGTESSHTHTSFLRLNRLFLQANCCCFLFYFRFVDSGGVYHTHTRTHTLCSGFILCRTHRVLLRSLNLRVCERPLGDTTVFNQSRSRPPHLLLFFYSSSSPAVTHVTSEEDLSLSPLPSSSSLFSYSSTSLRKKRKWWEKIDLV